MNEIKISKKSLMLKHPFTCIIAGPTMSGKTMLLRRLLKHHQNLINFSKTVIKVLWVHGQDQSLHSVPVQNVEVAYTKQMPDEEMVNDYKPDMIIIFDDLMNELSQSKELANLFIKGAHHLNISVIFIVQNLFHKGPVMRTISVNSHYIFLMKNPRDKLQIQVLGRQMFPQNSKAFVSLFEKVTKDAFGYLLIDLKADTPEHLRLRSKITPEDRLDNSFKQDVYSL